MRITRLLRGYKDLDTGIVGWTVTEIKANVKRDSLVIPVHSSLSNRFVLKKVIGGE